MNVEEGEDTLAVDGVPIDVAKVPWAAFQGLADKTVELMVSDKPTMDSARTSLVQTMNNEATLLLRAWLEVNGEVVDKQTGGKIGYVCFHEKCECNGASFCLTIVGGIRSFPVVSNFCLHQSLLCQRNNKYENQIFR